MAHINTLYDNDFYYIFHLVLGKPPSNLGEWKKQLPLLQVCRKWYDMLYHYVYTWGFIDIFSKSGYKYCPDKIEGCVYYSDDEIVCLSNLGIITGRNKYNCKYMSSVCVVAYEGLSVRRYSPVLKELLELGVGYWISLTSLEFFGCVDGEFYGYLDKGIPKAVETIDREHIIDFKRRAPNITRLHVDWDSSITYYMLPILIHIYAGRLQYLDCRNPIQRLPFIHSNELTHLSIELDERSLKIPNIYARPLRYLELRYLSGDFAWLCFHDGLSPGCIEFTNLETFKVGYRLQTAGEKERSLEYSKRKRPYGSHMLRFPKLSELFLTRCPVDCDVLFTDTLPSHIKLLHVSGDVNSIAAASILRLAKVDVLKVDVTSGRDMLSDDFYKAADYYFGTTLIGSDRRLDLEPTLDVQRTGSWMNLTCIKIETIPFGDLLKLIPKLYNLQELKLGFIELGDDFTSVIGHGLEEEKKSRIEQMDTKIAHIFLDNVKPGSQQSFDSCTNYLLTRMPTVRSFESTRYNTYYDVYKTVSSTKHPHVTLI